MTSLASQSNLRKKVELAYREYRALLILTGALTVSEREGIDRSLAILPQLSRKRLQTEQSKIFADLNHWKRYLGAKGGLKLYEIILKQPSPRPGTVLWVPKYMILEYFAHYDRIMTIFRSLPLHARIAVDIQGILKLTTREIGWTILEAKLFEDMAVLWNDSLSAGRAAEGTDQKILAKRAEALLRATARSAFHMLEGYLNGLAFDALLLLKGELNEDEIAALSEGRDKKGRLRLLTLRDKLLQYPKIAARRSHPAFDENTSAEMKTILGYEVSVRHALVHPTPRDEPAASELRESVFFSLTTDMVAELIDSVIGLVRKVSGVAGASFGDVALWLHSRRPDGSFGEETFR